MDCASCRAILEELLRGELPARQEAEARSHLAQCASCRAVHMPMLRAAEASAAPAAPRRASHLRWGLHALSLLRRKATGRSSPAFSPPPSGMLARLARAPQVAMGSVMLLIVLVGLWSLPQLTRRQGIRFSSSGLESQQPNRPAAIPETDTSAALAGAVANAGAQAKPSDAMASASSDGMTPTAAKASRRDQADARRKNDLESALQHYQAREYALSTPLFSRALITATSPADQAKALLYLARAERALGHCDRAVNSYATLVRVHPGKGEALAALREGVACYDRLAEPGRAQRLLEQAASSSELATGARSLLSQRSSGSAHKTSASGHSDSSARPD
jgi:tetratricopeptide (TPR) repeat protein